MTTRTHAGPLPAQLVEPVAVSVAQRRIVAMASSILLTYPDESFDERVTAVEELLAVLPAPVAEELGRFTTGARHAGRREMETHYVETFDQRRRCSLFLSYYSVGDTRQRGTAILAFRQQLEGLGMAETTDELPDHLCVLLEALARVDDDKHPLALEMIAAHRDGIEVLRSALINVGSIYQHLITALAMVLPQIDEETINRYINLIKSGPPAEVVGISQLPFPTRAH